MWNFYNDYEIWNPAAIGFQLFWLFETAAIWNHLIPVMWWWYWGGLRWAHYTERRESLGRLAYEFTGPAWREEMRVIFSEEFEKFAWNARYAEKFFPKTIRYN